MLLVPRGLTREGGREGGREGLPCARVYRWWVTRVTAFDGLSSSACQEGREGGRELYMHPFLHIHNTKKRIQRRREGRREGGREGKQGRMLLLLLGKTEERSSSSS